MSPSAASPYVNNSYFMIPVSKGQKAVRVCTIRRLNLGHAKYEKVAIYAVNQRISNIWRIAGAAELGRNPGYQMSGKRPFDTHIILYHLLQKKDF